MSQPCTNNCKCWAEFGMTGWDEQETWYQACILNTENEGTEGVSSTMIKVKMAKDIYTFENVKSF